MELPELRLDEPPSKPRRLCRHLDNYGQGLPLQPFLCARVIIDLSQPFVSGCFVPLVGNRVSWVYVRYEGFYKSVRNAAVSDTT